MSTTFGDKLKAIRKDKRWSLDKMAEFLGTNKQTLSRYERGERTPKISDVDAFAAKLGIPLEDFSEHKGTMRIASTDTMPFHPDVIDMVSQRIEETKDYKENEILSLFATMTDTDKDKLLDYARFIVDSYKRPDKRRK